MDSLYNQFENSAQLNNEDCNDSFWDYAEGDDVYYLESEISYLFRPSYMSEEEQCVYNDKNLSRRNALDLILNKNLSKHTDGISIERDNDFCDIYLDCNGDSLLGFEFENIFCEAGFFYDGIAPVLIDLNCGKDFYCLDNGECCGGRWGFINLKGDFVVEPKFEIPSFFYGEIAAFAIDTKIEDTSSGYRCFGGKWGLLDRKGKVLIPAKYVHINLLSENLIAANLGGCRDYSLLTDGGNWALLNKYGRLLTNFKYNYIYAFHEGRAIFNINGIRESIEIYSVDSSEIIGGEWGY